MAGDEILTARAALARAYAPASEVRVGILLVAGAFSDDESAQAVDDALQSAGHTALRRCARLQPRPGEAELRAADVIAFLDLYGHEYATAAFRPWAAARGDEDALTAAAQRAGCRTIWEIEPGDPATVAVASQSVILVSRNERAKLRARR